VNVCTVSTAVPSPRCDAVAAPCTPSEQLARAVASVLIALLPRVTLCVPACACLCSTIPLLMEFLTVPELRDGACGCLFEVINKGMDDCARVRLIASLRVVEVIRTLKFDVSNPDDVGAYCCMLHHCVAVVNRLPAPLHDPLLAAHRAFSQSSSAR
jgi:hypothetical protein